MVGIGLQIAVLLKTGGASHQYSHLHPAEVCYRYNHRNKDLKPLIYKLLKQISIRELKPTLVRKGWELSKKRTATRLRLVAVQFSCLSDRAGTTDGRITGAASTCCTISRKTRSAAAATAAAPSRVAGSQRSISGTHVGDLMLIHHHSSCNTRRFCIAEDTNG